MLGRDRGERPGGDLYDQAILECTTKFDNLSDGTLPYSTPCDILRFSTPLAPP